MARLNDPPQLGNESLEAVKKRYIRQNREIARVNSTQSIRIRSLESETTRLLSENIELREQVIKLQATLDKRERSKVVLENVEATKRQLEGKVAEMQELVRSLGKAISPSPQVKPPPKQKAYIVSPEQRTWKSGLSFSDVMGTEGSLPAISEDARSRRSSLNVDELRRTSLNGDSRRSSLNMDEGRINSINFEEITLLPTPRLDDAESDEDLRPPVSSFLDIRPRRRRDSALPEAFNPIAPSKAQPQIASGTKPKKRRHEDRDQAQDEPPLNFDFRFTKLSQRTDVAKQPTETQKPLLALVVLDEPEGEGNEQEEEETMVREELTGIEKIVEAGRRAIGLDLEATRESVTSSTAPTIGRRALGPKSTNSDPSNSPLKQAAIKATLIKERDFEKPELIGPPKMKSFDTDIKTADTDVGTGRPSRRTKASVNYALPNLRDKMRREEKIGESLRGEGKTSRRVTGGGRLRGKDSAEELVVKIEESHEVEGTVEKQWSDLPVLPHTALAIDAADGLRKVKETGISGLLERKPSREDDLEQTLPTSVMTHRKRRPSSLHQGPLADLVYDGTNGRKADVSQMAIPNGSKRKTVSFDPSSMTSGEGSQSRDRIEGTSLKRKQMIYSHLPPSSSVVDVVGEASAALNEAVRGTRRITLGGAARGTRNVKSYANLVGGDETEMEDNRPTSELGMASRRRSMML